MTDAMALSPEIGKLVAQTREVIRDFHFALDMRHNAGAQAWECMRRLEALYNMPWEQNAELRRRGIGQHKQVDKEREDAGKL